MTCNLYTLHQILELSKRLLGTSRYTDKQTDTQTDKTDTQTRTRARTHAPTQAHTHTLRRALQHSERLVRKNFSKMYTYVEIGALFL